MKGEAVKVVCFERGDDWDKLVLRATYDDGVFDGVQIYAEEEDYAAFSGPETLRLMAELEGLFRPEIIAEAYAERDREEEKDRVHRLQTETGAVLDK